MTSKSRVERRVLEVRAKYGVIDRPFNKADFFRICEAENISLIHPDRMPEIRVPFVVPQILGFMFHYDGSSAIYLKCFWFKRFRLDVAFHELGHYFLDHKGMTLSKAFQESRNGPVESEADLFASLATSRGK